MKTYYIAKDITHENKSPHPVYRRVSYKLKPFSRFEISHSKSFIAAKNALGFVRIDCDVKLRNPDKPTEFYDLNFYLTLGTFDKVSNVTIKDKWSSRMTGGGVGGRLPSNRSAKIYIYRKVVKDLELTYNATWTVKGRGPSFYNHGKMDAIAIRSFMQKVSFHFEQKELESTLNKCKLL